jgi:AcrR family transcriptional regulator
MSDETGAMIRPPATPHNPREERADAAANRARILDAAGRLFAEQGVAAVHMEEIATAAQVGKGTLYRRFANKGELCLALLQCEFEQFRIHTTAHLAEMRQSGQRPVDQAAWFIEAALDFNDDHLALLCEATRDGTIDVAIEQQPIEWQSQVLGTLLDEVLAQGSINLPTDGALLADLLMASLRPATLNLYRHGRGYSRAQMSDLLRRLLYQLAAA